MISSMRLRNFRCFREAEAETKPLTILVGENSAGKTSFMAMAKAALESAFLLPPPRFQYFNSAPFFLGGFEDVVYCPHSIPNSEWFEATLNFAANGSELESPAAEYFGREIKYTVRFAKHGTSFLPVKRKFEWDDVWAEMNFRQKGDSYDPEIKFGIENRSWKFNNPQIFESRSCGFTINANFDELFFHMRRCDPENSKESNTVGEVISKKPHFSHDAKKTIELFLGEIEKISSRVTNKNPDSWIYASSPVKTGPLRIYDPSSAGDEALGCLANLARTNFAKWKCLKSKLEEFGKKSDLFDEIKVDFLLEDTSSSPFRLLFRKSGGARLKGGWKNMIDIGFGVSQSLPLLVDLLREDSPNIVFLQQPEVHLHPKAQASFGSLICELAAAGKWIFIETHSDTILCRIRMDVRDEVVNLSHNNVCTLFFERIGQEAKIHTMGFNQQGNITRAPDHYRKFFLMETKRNIHARYKMTEKKCA